jgi:hypothetical protein
MEGSAVYDATRCRPGPRVPPILEYPHAAGDCSVTGGFRYRGRQYPGLFGVYLFADFCTGRIWGGYQSGSGAWSSALLLDSSLLISSFGEDRAGELYVADLNGGLYRVDIATQITSLTADHSFPQPVGTAITWTVVATGGTGSYEYRFWRYDVASNTWTVVRDYAPSDTFLWTPTANDIGQHAFGVWVRSAGSSAPWEGYLGTVLFPILP